MSVNEKNNSSEERVIVKRYRELKGFPYWLAILFCIVVLLISFNWIFDTRFFMNIMMESYTFYYLVVAFFGSLVFLYVPASKNLSKTWAKRWAYIDGLFALIVFASCCYLAYNAYNIYSLGWERVPPLTATIVSVILWLLFIEMTRRCAGTVLTIVVAVASLLPLYTQYLPGVLNGLHRPFLLTAQMHILGTYSTVGTLLRTFADIMIPYTIFGTVVIACGGGAFFLDLAVALFGRFRGGTGKVAIISSALFGSVSGSPIVNVMTTGSVTIPAMKRTGFEPHVAGAVECVASTGGTLTPPIMGTASFVMASLLGISYADVAIAAIVPILLYYISFLLQLDFYSVKKGLKGLPASELPSLRKTLKDGWIFIPTMLVLIFGIFVLRLIAQSALYASLVALVLAQFNKNTRFSKERFLKMIEQIGTNCMELAAVMLGVGFLLGSFTITGIGISFPREIFQLAGGNTVVLIILTAVASLVMGLGMTTIACYIFLSIVIAPALVLGGLDPITVHMFLLYCGMLSYITPPVAMAAFPAGVIAEASATKVGFTGMRLGIALFFIPFFFVADVNMVLQGNMFGSIQSIGTALLAVILISQASQGYIIGIGKLWFKTGANQLISVIMFVSGGILGLPGTLFDIVGLVVTVIVLVPLYLLGIRRSRAERLNEVGI